MANPFALTEIQGDAPAKDSNPYSMDAILADERTVMRSTLLGAQDSNPEQVAKAVKLGRQIGAPAEAVEAHLPEVERVTRLDAYEKMLAGAPRTTEFLKDPLRAKLAHDDVDNLVALEKEIGSIKPSQGPEASFGTVMSGLLRSLPQGTELARQGIRRQLADLFGFETVQADIERKTARAQTDVALSTPQFESSTAAGIYAGGTSLMRQIPGVAASLLTRSTAPMLATIGIQTEAEAYGKYRNRGATPGQAAVGAVGEGAVEVGTELLPMSFLVKQFGRAGAGQFLTGILAREIPGEQIATVVQDAIDTAVANPDKTWQQYLQERPDAAYQTLVATVVQGGAMGAINTAATYLGQREQKAMAAQQGAATLQRINDLVAASKLKERDRETLETFLAQNTTDENGDPQLVRINAAQFEEALLQSGLDPQQVLADLPSAAEQFAAARETGGDLVVPVAEIAARTFGTDAGKALLPHIALGQDGISPFEAETYLQTQQDEFRQEAQKILAEKEADDVFQASAREVEADVLDQLNTAGRFTADANQAYSKLMAEFFAVMAGRTGATPAELYQQYRPTIVAEGVVKGLNQEAGLEGIRQQWTDSGISHAVSEKDGIITVSKIIVPEAERGTGKGTAAMQALVDYADRTGQHVALSPSADFGGTKKRLVEFYKRFGFVENKGKNRAFSTSESMYREAPGKALYQSDTLNRDVRGAMNPSTLTIGLFEAADLSTFLHEGAHFFLEVMADIASRQDAPANIRADMDAVLAWFEIPASPDVSALERWAGMTLDEKRPYHEKWAETFEQYLLTGKAPSLDLRQAFQKFKAWLLRIYKSLKDFAAAHPTADLSPEISQVFDRLLATGEQIQLAEEARSMFPLFDSEEQSGWTPEEFAAYQALARDATETAKEELEARGLQDMKWLGNARSKALKELQKEAKSIRAMVQMEARREVMSQPLYRAWQFLTGKMTKDNKVETPQPVSSSPPAVLDETMDTLFQAIGKLGGLNKQEVIETWGTDPADKPQSGVFGKPLWRIEGGLSLDGMAETLGQYGYLTLDENGKPDLAEFEERFNAELRGDTQYSNAYAPEQFFTGRPGDQVANLEGLTAGRLALPTLAEIGLPQEIINHLAALKMTAKDGLHPDIVAELFGFSSGDELVRTIAAAPVPKDAIEAQTDRLMVERYADLSSPEAIERAADAAVHNEARARLVATELRALMLGTNVREKTARGGSVNVLLQAAREFAADLVARKKVRDLKASPFALAAERAGKEARSAVAKGENDRAMAEKRNQMLNLQAAREAEQARVEIDKAVAYLKKFEKAGTRKAIDRGYLEQIDSLLERFDLRSKSLKAIDRTTGLAQWIEAQQEQGIEPDIPPELLLEASRKHYKDMTVEEFRGLVDSIRQIEHLGRLKQKLLTARDQRAFEAVRDEILASIEANANGRTADNVERNTLTSKAATLWKGALAIHRKMASVVRELDGFKDGGPMWNYFLRAMNAAGDREATLRAEATEKLFELVQPVLAQGHLGGKGVVIPGVFRKGDEPGPGRLGSSFNREERIAVALNAGNEGNLQRLMSGEGWNLRQVNAILATLSRADLEFVQQVWDFFESYRPQIAEKEKRVMGKEPDWVKPQPITIQLSTGETVALKGGYYPIKYDANRSSRADQQADAEEARAMMKSAFTSAMTRRSFTKSRTAEVHNRPLTLSFDGIFQGTNEVIHDLAWHEWLIDANKLLRSLDQSIRDTYGKEFVQVLKKGIEDIARGDVPAQHRGERILNHLRTGATVAGLGWNLTTALLQPLGLTQSMVRVGPVWVAKGLAQWLKNPLGTVDEIAAKSEFMANRAKTMLREINEIQNQVGGDKSRARTLTEASFFILIQKLQLVSDVPTWLGAYEKAFAEQPDESRAVALADQAVIDAQGNGQIKDLSQVQRGGAAWKLFTNFYSFFNTALNLGIERTRATDFKSPAQVVRLAGDYLLLYSVPAVLGALLKEAIKGGVDDDDLVKKLAAEQISYLMGLFVLLREVTPAVQKAAGVSEFNIGYGGPAGLRFFQELDKLGQQIGQGEADRALTKSAINTAGVLFHLPAGQINRTIDGTAALVEGRTSNPLAVVVGPPPK
jgi:GNAT superfamily N-acetyltransferase